MKRVLITLLCLLVMMTAAHASAETWYIDGKTSDRVHLRAAPDGESLGLYFQGTPVQYEPAYFNTGWAYVTIGAEEGYVDLDYLTREQPESRNPVCLVNNPDSSWVNLRAKPTTQSESLGKYDNGTAVIALGETSTGWFCVSIGDQTGYMLAGMLSPVQEEVQMSRLTEVVGRTSDGWCIHAYEADNGQMLYFTALEAEVNILYDDVNFDGIQDLVIYTSMGASNAYCEFFVWHDGRYVMAEHPAIDYALPNYQLYPEKGIVATHANNGYAGAAYEECLFRWEGTKMKLIRRGVSENTKIHSFVNGVSTETTDHDKVTITVYDYTGDRAEGILLDERTVPLGDGVYEETQQANKILWQGI